MSIVHFHFIFMKFPYLIHVRHRYRPAVSLRFCSLFTSRQLSVAPLAKSFSPYFTFLFLFYRCQDGEQWCSSFWKYGSATSTSSHAPSWGIPPSSYPRREGSYALQQRSLFRKKSRKERAIVHCLCDRNILTN